MLATVASVGARTERSRSDRRSFPPPISSPLEGEDQGEGFIPSSWFPYVKELTNGPDYTQSYVCCLVFFNGGCPDP